VIDDRLTKHWVEQRRARERARAGLPPSWRDDRRPEMADVREAYVEAIARLHRPALRIVREED
jgi:hypothetical protein